MEPTSKEPNIEFLTTKCYDGSKQLADFPHNEKLCFSIAPELVSPRSRGSVRLRSRDLRANPMVEHNHLSDALDLKVLAEAWRLGRDRDGGEQYERCNKWELAGQRCSS